MDSLALLQEFVSTPGPPGQEDLVREALIRHLTKLGVASTTDPKGNLIVRIGFAERSKIVVTAHMDEIAMMVRQILPDGSLTIAPLGGIFPWKLGEGPVTILASSGSIEGILSVGSIHTESPMSAAKAAKTTVLTWDMVTVRTGQSPEALIKSGVRSGTRVVVSPSQRALTHVGPLVSGYFLDDRADLVSWLLAIESLKDSGLDVTFVATASEEVGGEGALYFLTKEQPDFCIALELGPNTPDAPVAIDNRPTVWTSDGYATMPPFLGDLIQEVSNHEKIPVQYQPLSRGGSDASCAAAKGLCAHPITLGLPMENSHGYEMMHPDAMTSLAKLTVGLIQRLSQ